MNIFANKLNNWSIEQLSESICFNSLKDNSDLINLNSCKLTKKEKGISKSRIRIK